MKLTKSNFILSLIVCLIFPGVSCSDELVGKDDELSIQRQDYNGKDLLLNGIYYLEIQSSQGISYQRYALYRNGVIRDLGGSKEKNDPRFLSGKSKADWGVFQINNDEIKFERWYPSSGGAIRAFLRKGIILNDSTFKITKSYRNQNGEKTEIRETDEFYHFILFSPKPDSNNNFIK